MLHTRRGRICILVLAVVVATAIGLGVFYWMHAQALVRDTGEALAGWADLARELLEQPAPDSAEIERRFRDPLTGQAKPGLVVLDHEERALLANRQDPFSSPDRYQHLRATGAEPREAIVDDVRYLYRREPLAPIAPVGAHLVVYAEYPVPALEIPGPFLSAGVALLVGFIVLAIGLEYVLTADVPAEGDGSSRGDKGPGGDALTLNPRTLGLLSGEVLALAKRLRAEERDTGSVDWEDVGRHVTRLLDVATDMARLADLAADAEIPTEAVSVGGLIEDAVANTWDVLGETEVSVRVPRGDLLLEADGPAFLCALEGLLRYAGSHGTALVIHASLKHGRLQVSVTRTPEGEDQPGRPSARAYLGLEIARAVAKNLGGTLYGDAGDARTIVLSVPQWQANRPGG